MTPTILLIDYNNFSDYLKLVGMLLMGNTKEADAWLSIGDNKSNMKIVVGALRHNGTVCPIELKPLHRGILLDNLVDVTDNKLKPISYIQTISFTEDKAVALDFADTKSDMSSFVMMYRPSSKGYLIEHTPLAQDILFHYSWVEDLNLLKVITTLDAELINQQKEVILFQSNKQFDLVGV